MMIVDYSLPDGSIETIITVRGRVLNVTRDEMSPDQVAAAVAEALGEPVWWLDRAGNAEKRDE